MLFAVREKYQYACFLFKYDLSLITDALATESYALSINVRNSLLPFMLMIVYHVILAKYIKYPLDKQHQMSICVKMTHTFFIHRLGSVQTKRNNVTTRQTWLYLMVTTTIDNSDDINNDDYGVPFRIL